MKINLVIPAHNEEDIIAKTINSIEEELKLDYGIILVNDHSTDRTAAIARELMDRYKNIKLVDNDAARGFASALKKGFEACDADFIIPVMADLCDDPRTIYQMYAKLQEGFDIVTGSRYMKGGGKVSGPMIQSFFSRLVGCSLKYFIRIPTFDVSNSFKCYRKEILKAIDIKSRGFEISMEVTLKAYFSGAKITEVPTVWRGRMMGKSKFYLIKAAPPYIKLYFWAIIRKGLGIWRRLY